MKRYKVAVLGEAGVGKSSIIQRFIYDTFNEQIETTLGAYFHQKEFVVGMNPVKLSIWDTAGQEKYASLAHMYYKDAQAALVVFDITKIDSFERAKKWINELHEITTEKIVIALVGNKTDLQGSTMNKGLLDSYVDKNSLLYFEASAKENKGIDNIFESLTKRLLNDNDSKSNNDRKGKKLKKDRKKREGCDC